MSATAGVWSRDWSEARDETLLRQVRAGESEAYAELWRRHLPSAYAVATRYRGRASVEDIVGEASLRIYDRIRAGKGPTSNFRSYFLTAVKTVAIDLGRVELRVVPTEPEELEYAGTAVQPYNAALRVDQDLVRVAFGRLSEFDQQVLWRTTVEGISPAVVGSTIGLSANRVSVAALRARDALRAEYLDAHADRAVERAKSEECRWVLARMGRYVRGGLRSRQRARVDQHLEGCRHARVLVAELTEINRGMPALLVPLIFVGGTSTVAMWASAGLVAGYGGVSAPQSPLADPSIATAASAGTATTAVMAKAAAVVAAGALGAGLMPAPSPGFDAASGGGQLQAAGLAPRSESRTVAGGLGLGGAGSSESTEAFKSAVKPFSETVAGGANVRSESAVISVNPSAAFAVVLTNLPTAVAAVMTTPPTTLAAAPASKTASGAAIAAAALSTASSLPASPTPSTPTSTAPTSTAPTSTAPTSTAPVSTAPTSTAPARLPTRRPGVDYPGVDYPGVDRPGLDGPNLDYPGVERAGIERSASTPRRRAPQRRAPRHRQLQRRHPSQARPLPTRRRKPCRRRLRLGPRLPPPPRSRSSRLPQRRLREKKTTSVTTSTGSRTIRVCRGYGCKPTAIVTSSTARIHDVNTDTLAALAESPNPSLDKRLQLQTRRRAGYLPAFGTRGFASRPRRPFHDRLTRCAATSAFLNRRWSTHHWPVSAIIPTSMCA